MSAQPPLTWEDVNARRPMRSGELSDVLRTVAGPVRAVRLRDGAVDEAFTVVDVVVSADGQTVDLVLE